MFLERFVLDLSANTCQTHHVTFRPWPFTLDAMALVCNTGPRSPSVYQDRSSQAFPFGRWRISSLIPSRPVDLYLWPWIWWALLPVVWATFLPIILMFLGRFILYNRPTPVRRISWQLRPWPLTLEVTAFVGDTGLRAPSTGWSKKEDIAFQTVTLTIVERFSNFLHFCWKAH